MVRVAHYGYPYPAITWSEIPEAAREKEAYLGGTYEGLFKLEYSPRMPTPREAVVALSYAVENFEDEHAGVRVVYAEIVHPSLEEIAAGMAVPSCRFQFTVEHHSPFPVALLIVGIAAAIAAGVAYSTAMALSVLVSVLVVVFLIAGADYFVEHVIRGPTIKCPKCGEDLDYLGVEGLRAHWLAKHSDQGEPDWEAMKEEYERAGLTHLIWMGVLGVGSVLGGLVAFKWAWGRVGKKKEKEKK